MSVKQGIYISIFTTAPMSSLEARSPIFICSKYCTASPMMPDTSIQRDRSYFLFFQRVCKALSATKAALIIIKMRQVYCKRYNASIFLVYRLYMYICMIA